MDQKPDNLTGVKLTNITMKQLKIFNKYKKILTPALLSLLFILSFSLTAFARSQPVYNIFRTTTPIIIDSKLDEPACTAAKDSRCFQIPLVEVRKARTNSQ